MTRLSRRQRSKYKYLATVISHAIRCPSQMRQSISLELCTVGRKKNRASEVYRNAIDACPRCQPVFFPNRGSQRPLLLTRVGLPVFTELRFQGVRRILGGPVKRALLFLKDHFAGLSVSRRPDS